MTSGFSEGKNIIEKQLEWNKATQESVKVKQDKTNKPGKAKVIGNRWIYLGQSKWEGKQKHNGRK